MIIQIRDPDDLASRMGDRQDISEKVNKIRKNNPVATD